MFGLLTWQKILLTFSLSLTSSKRLETTWQLRIHCNLKAARQRCCSNADAIIARPNSVCLSVRADRQTDRQIWFVCASHAVFLSRGMKIWSCGFRHQVEILLVSRGKFYPDSRRESPPARTYKWGTHQSLAKIWPRIGHNLQTVQGRR